MIEGKQARRFDYLLVVVSIIIGLALTHLLEGVGQIIQPRISVTVYWVHLVWVAVVFLACIVFWWAYWEYRDTEMTYFSYIVVLMGPILLFLLSDLLFPEPIDDLKTHFGNIHKPFFLLMFLYLLTAFLTALNIRKVPLRHGSNLFRFAGLTVATLGVFFHNDTFNNVLAALAIVLMISFIVQFHDSMSSSGSSQSR